MGEVDSCRSMLLLELLELLAYSRVCDVHVRPSFLLFYRIRRLYGRWRCLLLNLNVLLRVFTDLVSANLMENISADSILKSATQHFADSPTSANQKRAFFYVARKLFPPHVIVLTSKVHLLFKKKSRWRERANQFPVQDVCIIKNGWK